MTPEETAKLAVEAALDKKAAEMKVMKVTELTTLADYYVICSASSSTQMRAIGGSVEKAFSDRGIQPLHTEGYGASGWVLLDFGSVVVHIFNREVREFYALERLWGDAVTVDPATL